MYKLSGNLKATVLPSKLRHSLLAQAVACTERHAGLSGACRGAGQSVSPSFVVVPQLQHTKIRDCLELTF